MTTTARILVVDDEPDVEELVRQRFRRAIREGLMSFVFAGDGVSALDTLERDGAVDLVVTDINMPRMDGLTLLGRLQDRDDKPCTVIVSAYGDMGNIRSAMNRGAFDFLVKPIDFTDFETTITRTLNHVQEMRRARERLLSAERAQAALSRYFSPNVAAELAASGEAALAGARRDLTVMFTDIAGFTRLVEDLDPDVLARLLNDYFGGVTSIVFDHGGTVAKVMGDALYVLFGAPQHQDDHAVRAIACALAMDAFSEEVRQRWAAEGLSLGHTRIGLNSGTALVGNFGHTRFFDYTAYGDTINIAARLEAANKSLGTRICASETVLARAPGVNARPIGELTLRGRSTPLLCHEPLRAEADVAAYRAAYGKLAERDPAALAAFAAVVAASPDDKLASFHLRRLLGGETGTTLAMA
ncbi:adenylate/guanylate cyclase domain-containing protein [uncultured Alsobacter sp.]|uniref:adenylate/guanylate cyclase domain-containing protein n=1 Tax=uncultured Alsobacter sp. TaxID=1748258 RepID=UPI0025D87414|nr:adenylate/guanylate cyclase domain-containing protein [uncultured Alsobacter sp.]